MAQLLRRSLSRLLNCTARQCSFTATRSITSKSLNDSLQIDWENGTISSYPYIFLRDNCQCEKCFHPSAKQRLFDTAHNVPVDIKPGSVSQTTDAVNLTWEDGHQSSFEYNWLKERMFPDTDADVVSRNYCGLKPKTWGSELNGKIPNYDYDSFMKNDETLLSWLETVASTGIALLENAPESGDALSDFSKRLYCCIRGTHYGDIFHVMSKPDANNLAYTAGYLPLHTDLPFYRHQPGVQLLHCIQQAEGEGGENHFVDGFNIAEHLRTSDPEAFEILSTVKFLFNDVGKDMYGEFDKVYERPVIGLDMLGNVESIAHNNHVRSSYINAPADKVKKSYEAYYKLIRAMYDKDNLVTHKQMKGNVVTFNNQRVLHGRAAYKITSVRHLCGCYFDWDDIYSAIRIYRRKLRS